MGFRGGGVKLTPPQHILVFKYPSRDRVNLFVGLHKLFDPILTITTYKFRLLK